MSSEEVRERFDLIETRLFDGDKTMHALDKRLLLVEILLWIVISFSALGLVRSLTGIPALADLGAGETVADQK